jgi:hypothetical protein
LVDGSFYIYIALQTQSSIGWSFPGLLTAMRENGGKMVKICLCLAFKVSFLSPVKSVLQEEFQGALVL